MYHFLTLLLVLGLTTPSWALNKEFHSSSSGTETWITLKFTPTTSSFADVLFIIDNSGSMQLHQQNLAKNVALLTQAFSEYTSLHAAVITTDTFSLSNPKQPGVFVNGVHDSANPNFLSALTSSLTLGTQGDSIEQPFNAAYLALTEPLISTLNKGFLRDNADLYVVILTDTQDQSKIDENQLYTLLKTLKPTQTIATLAGMASDDPKICEGEVELKNNPPKIQNLVALTGGSVFSLCGDFAKNLTDAINVTVVAEKSLSLPTIDNKQVVFSTLTLEMNNQIIPGGDIQSGWYYDSAQALLLFSDPFLAFVATNGPMTITYQVK